ncbi:hypothetical protein GCM10027589_14860 [Actinocorallia lasiicapitis]
MPGPGAHSVAILGAGHLGVAVPAGLLQAGVPAGRLSGSALPAERADEPARRYGVRIGTDDKAAADRSRALTRKEH